MRMIHTLCRPPVSACLRLACVAAVAAFAIGCGSVPPAPEPVVTVRAPGTSATNPAVAISRGEFTMPASMLDTWNAVGQVLVRLDGVTYESRAQMLGIYGVRYRGERFLILTRALVLNSQAPGMVTQVGASLLDGTPKDSAAAIELLGLLQRRLPAEIARIAADGK